MANTIIPAGIDLRAFRSQIESKNTLQHRGSLYVGTGNFETINGIDCYKTEELLIGNDGDVLICDSNSTLGLKYGKITDNNLDYANINLLADNTTATANGITVGLVKDSITNKYKTTISCTQVTNAEHADTATYSTNARNAEYATTSSDPNSINARLSALEHSTPFEIPQTQGVATGDISYSLPWLEVGETTIYARRHSTANSGVCKIYLPQQGTYWYAYTMNCTFASVGVDDILNYTDANTCGSAAGGTRIASISRSANGTPSNLFIIYGRIS